MFKNSGIGHSAYKMSSTFQSQILPIAFFLVASLGGSTSFAIEGQKTFELINEARTVARTGNYPEALEKLQEAIFLADESGEKLPLAIAFNNIAEIHRLQGNTIEALEYYSQALQIYHEIGHPKGIASTGQKIDRILGRPKKTVEQTSTELSPPPPVELPTETREQRIEKAIDRIRNRVKDRQAQQVASTPESSEASGTTATVPQEPLHQSAELKPPQDTRQMAYTSYLERVKKNIVRAWQYPEQASEEREEGKVDVEFTILKDGRLLDVRIL